MESFKFKGGQFSWIVGVLLIRGNVISWLRWFSDSVRKLTLSKFVFIKDVNSWGSSATHEYHEN